MDMTSTNPGNYKGASYDQDTIYTVTSWARSVCNGGAGGTRGFVGTGNQFWAGINSANPGKYRLTFGGAGDEVDSTTDAGWAHVAATANGASGGEMFINGASEATDASAVENETNLPLGLYGAASTGNNFCGLLGDIRLYGHVLSDNMIAHIANMRGGDKVVYGLQAWWMPTPTGTFGSSVAAADLVDHSGQGQAMTSLTGNAATYTKSALFPHRRSRRRHGG